MAALVGVSAVLFVASAGGAADWRVIDAGIHHLRSGDAAAPREWEEFAERAEAGELVVRFEAEGQTGEHTLRLRQRDVKQAWRVTLNGTSLGTLVQDESEITTVFAVPAGVIRGGGNELRVARDGNPEAAADDVSLGRVELVGKPRAEVLAEASLRLKVVDGDGGAPLPCRVTIVDEAGALATTGSASGGTVAVRPGVLYPGSGGTTFALSAGKYMVYAGRGFEYSIASEVVALGAGESAARTLTIRRVVPTDGFVACDPHVHTLTYSRHGDATVDERVLTLAGEGIELPVAAEHNLQVDYAAAAEKLGVRRYFTPVRGNEVTTPSLGHFNVFPIPPAAPLVNVRVRDWDALARSVAHVATNPVVVLNHARDVHGGFAPFDPRRHVSVAGESTDGHALPANAMEVINSGATRADPMELFRDWFGMLNRGRRVAPIGASDSHDVSRYIVGQARTYVSYAPDADPSMIDVSRAADAIAAGRVTVSYGLLTHLTVAGRFTPGDLATPAGGPPPPAETAETAAPPPDGDVAIDIRVLGPEWTTATSVALYANGVEIRRADIPPPAAGAAPPVPVKWQGRWNIARPTHDVHLVAIASGPGVAAPYWPAAKPYQPMSPRWQSYVLGATGAVYLDADGNGRFDSAHDYATRIVAEGAATSGSDPGRLAAAIAARLKKYDEAVAAQVASVLRARDPANFESTCRRIMNGAAPAVARGIAAYLGQWEQTKR